MLVIVQFCFYLILAQLCLTVSSLPVSQMELCQSQWVTPV